MIEEGYYNARAVRIKDDNGADVWATFGRASTGTRQMLMQFELIDDGEHKGKRLPWIGFFTNASWERTVESLRHCGFQGNDLDRLNEQNLDQVVSVKVEHETSQSNGRVYVRIAFVNAAGSGSVKLSNPMSRGELRDFSAMMKNRIAGISGSTPSQPTRDPLDGLL